MSVVTNIEADRNQDISRDNNEEPVEALRQNEWLQFRICRLGVQGVEKKRRGPRVALPNTCAWRSDDLRQTHRLLA